MEEKINRTERSILVKIQNQPRKKISSSELGDVAEKDINSLLNKGLITQSNRTAGLSALSIKQNTVTVSKLSYQYYFLSYEASSLLKKNRIISFFKGLF